MCIDFISSAFCDRPGLHEARIGFAAGAVNQGLKVDSPTSDTRVTSFARFVELVVAVCAYLLPPPPADEPLNAHRPENIYGTFGCKMPSKPSIYADTMGRDQSKALSPARKNNYSCRKVNVYEQNILAECVQWQHKCSCNGVRSEWYSRLQCNKTSIYCCSSK